MNRRPLTWVIPYYRNAPMLEVHVRNWSALRADILERLTVILVDDGSPEADRPDAILRAAPPAVRDRVRLLRVLVDIPWNQHGARNLGAYVADDGWMIVADIDRVLLQHDLDVLQRVKLSTSRWYKPWGVRMHATLLAADPPKGPYNQFVVHRSTYWKAGGYDEDYCGCYGGDRQFLESLAAVAKLTRLESVRMYRYTRYTVAGANTEGLDRSTEEFARRKADKIARGDVVPRNPIRFPWEEVRL